MDKKIRSIEYCINGFFREVDKRRIVDHADKNSVRRYNAAYDRCYNHVKYIDEHYPESIGVLVDLLNHPDLRVVGHIAPMILKLNNVTKDHKEIALQAVRRIIASPDTDPLDRWGFSISLERWKEEISSE